MTAEADLEMFILLGAAVYSAQNLEYSLYGIAAHCSHLPQAQNNKLFANLTPRDFLSHEPEKRALRRATLGTIGKTFGDVFRLPKDELEDLVSRRNFIVHEFSREVFAARTGKGTVPDLHQFLKDFIHDCEEWKSAIKGLLSHLIEGAAVKQGRSNEFELTPQQLIERLKYAKLLVKWLAEQETK